MDDSLLQRAREASLRLKAGLADERTPFVFDEWYVAAFAAEVMRTPLGRRLLGIPVMLLRRTDGGVMALKDRCAHRSMPFRWAASRATPSSAATTARASVATACASPCLRRWPCRLRQSCGPSRSSSTDRGCKVLSRHKRPPSCRSPRFAGWIQAQISQCQSLPGPVQFAQAALMLTAYTRGTAKPWRYPHKICRSPGEVD